MQTHPMLSWDFWQEAAGIVDACDAHFARTGRVFVLLGGQSMALSFIHILLSMKAMLSCSSRYEQGPWSLQDI